MLNYSKKQYDEDRAKMGSKNKLILDEKFKVWEKIASRCSTSHIINPIPSKKLEATNFRKAEKTQADIIKKLVLTKSKLKDYDNNHEEEND